MSPDIKTVLQRGAAAPSGPPDLRAAARRGRTWKTRRLIVSGSFGAAAVAAVVAIAVAALGSEGVDRAPHPASSPTWEIETSRVQLDDQPYAVYGDGPALWVSGGRGTVVEIRDRPVAEYPHPTGPLGITVVDGEVWTTAASEERHGLAGIVVLDSETGEVVRTIGLPGDSPYGIDHAQGGVFVALHDGELLRIDPRDESTERVRLGNGLTQVLATDDAVWVSQPRAGAVWRVTFDGGEPKAEAIPLGEGGRRCPQGSAASEESVLVADPCAGKVWKLDPRDGAVAGALSDAGRRPTDVAVGDGWIYVVSSQDGRVTVFDESTLEEVGGAQAGPGAISVAAGAGVAWVANMDDSSVTRIEVRKSE
ncbi:MAG TPA: hypothetical protein VHJ76_08400 [Actinomycetota bacterium]|nr:hypothetical protein [Actinomycetota bacterium]